MPVISRRFRAVAICFPGVALALGVGLSATPAPAITCDKGFQTVQGNQIATPYCQDEYLAVVARQFGVKASADRIRNDPSYKREVCRIAGRDIRVQSSCPDQNSPGRGGRF
jgi:hypothetical protein